MPWAILSSSPHLSRSLEVVDCSAVSANHLEAELFGSKPGAHPGSVDRVGALERADGGILFFDEIAEMTPDHQGTVLRLVESWEGRRLGVTQPHVVGLSVIAATSQDLRALVARGEFREDLYYRLVQDGIIRVPPLRERLDDIPILARAFLAELPGSWKIEARACAALRERPWPGNVRQLRAVIRRAAHCASGARLSAQAVREAYRLIAVPTSHGLGANPAHPHGGSFDAATSALRRRMVVEALAACGGNQTLAGLQLGFHLARYGDSSNPELAARKLAHRKFRYWWARLVDGDGERGGDRLDPAGDGRAGERRLASSRLLDRET